MKKYDSASVQKLMSRRPHRSNFSAPDSSSAAVSYQLTTTVAAHRSGELAALVGDLPGFDIGKVDGAIFSVSHSQEWTAVKPQSAALLSANWSFVRDPGGLQTWCDHSSRQYIELDKDQVIDEPPARTIEASIDWLGEASIEGHASRIARIRITKPHVLSLKVWVTADADLQPFAALAMQRMVGCPMHRGSSDLQALVKGKLGFPLRTEIYSAAFGTADAPLVTHTVGAIGIQTAKAEDYRVPERYTDMRGASAASQSSRHSHSVNLRKARGNSRKRASTQASRAANPAAPVAKDSGFVGVTSGVKIPQCLPSTLGAQIAVEVEQLLMDDIKFLGNAVLSRLNEFDGQNGSVVIDWLAQWAASPAVAGGDDGLYCLLRDPADLTANPPVLGGQGLLDAYAERRVRAAMLDGSILSLGLILPGALQLAITNALASSPAQPFDSLDPTSQAQLRELFLMQLIGSFSVNFPTSTPTSTVFHGLVNVKLEDLEFKVDLRNTSPITALDLGDNLIHLQIELPYVYGNANVLRWPTGLYWAVLGVDGLGCLFFPFLCSLLPLIVAVGLFLITDYANFTVRISNLLIDADISFQPDAAMVLRPQVALQLDGDVDVAYIGIIPDGVDQILSLIYSIILDHIDYVKNLLQSQIQSALNRLLTNTLNLSWPPQFGPVPLSALQSETDGVQQEYLYLETALDAGLVGVSAPFITQVASDVEDTLLGGRLQSTYDANGHPMFRAYGGVVLSQNIINYYVNTMWRSGSFDYQLTDAQIADVVTTLQPLVDLTGQTLEIHLWPAVTPRTVFTPSGQLTNGAYACTYFDDVRLCIASLDSAGAESSVVELRFAAKAFTQFGFGAVNSSVTPPTLDITRVNATFADLYFDLSRLHISLIDAEVQDVVQTGTLFSAMQLASLPQLQSTMLLTLQYALNSRDDSVVPVDPANPGVQHYVIPGGTVDFHFNVSRGNVYYWFGISGTPVTVLNATDYGILSVFPGGPLEIDQISCNIGAALRQFV